MGKLAGSLVIGRNWYFQETFNESGSVHIDCIGLFRDCCLCIMGFNKSDFSKRVLNTLSFMFFIFSFREKAAIEQQISVLEKKKL